MASSLIPEKFTPPPLVIDVNTADSPPKYCIIWLHGLGASGYDFESIVPEIPVDLPIRYVFPHALNMPVTINMGMVMPAWYDIKTMAALDEDVDWDGVSASEAFLNDLVDAAMEEGFESHQILLAGFSQGGVIAYRCALKSSRKLAGVMALSTYLPWKAEEAVLLGSETPVWIAHGLEDPVVPVAAAEDAKSKLEKAGLKPTVSLYTMAHQVCFEEIEQMGVFIRQVFASAD